MRHLELPLLPPASQSAWLDYFRDEGRVPRQQMLASLDAFLAEVAGVEEPERDAWSLALAESVLEGGAPLLLRRRLLDALILPALARGFQASAPRPTKWLSMLANDLFGNRALCEQLGFPDEIEILRLAVERNPDDESCRPRLRDRLTEQFRYALHELPSGVLFGNDGATLAEMEVLLRELQLLETLGPTDTEVLERARFHFPKYAEFLRNPVGSYEAFFLKRMVK